MSDKVKYAVVRGYQRYYIPVLVKAGSRSAINKHKSMKARLGQDSVPQAVLGGIGRLPLCEHLDRRRVQRHLRTNRSPVGTGSRGPEPWSG